MALKSLLVVCQILHVSYISSGPDYIWGNGTHFWWHTEESWLFSPPKEALAQLIYCLSGNYLIQQWFIEHLLYVKCSLEYVAFYSTWHLFSPVTHMTTLHVRVWWRSWPLYDGWRNWCLGLLALNSPPPSALSHLPFLWRQTHLCSALSSWLFILRLHMLDES